MKKILFILCAVLLVSCSDYDTASSIISKYCYDYTVNEKAGETRFVQFRYTPGEEVHATLKLDKEFGRYVEEEKKEVDENGNIIRHTTKKWNNGKVKLEVTRGKYISTAVFTVRK